MITVLTSIIQVALLIIGIFAFIIGAGSDVQYVKRDYVLYSGALFLMATLLQITRLIVG